MDGITDGEALTIRLAVRAVPTGTASTITGMTATKPAGPFTVIWPTAVTASLGEASETIESWWSPLLARAELSCPNEALTVKLSSWFAAVATSERLEPPPEQLFSPLVQFKLMPPVAVTV